MQFLKNQALRNDEKAVGMFAKLLQVMPQIVPSMSSTDVIDEWRIYKQMEDMPSEWHTDVDGNQKRIDEYWSTVLAVRDDSGKMRFKLLDKVIKPLLCLSHGNAGPERGFSVNKRIFSTERSSSCPASVNGLRTVQDTICISGGILNVCITPSVLLAVRGASARYCERLQAEKLKKEKLAQQAKEAEMEEQKKTRERDEEKHKQNDFAEMKKVLDEDNKEINDIIKTVQLMMTNVNDSLQKAIKSKDLHKAEVAKAMLLAAKKRLQVAKSNSAKRDSLMQSALKKACKTKSSTTSSRPKDMPSLSAGSNTTTKSKSSSASSTSGKQSGKRSHEDEDKSGSFQHKAKKV